MRFINPKGRTDGKRDVAEGAVVLDLQASQDKAKYFLSELPPDNSDEKSLSQSTFLVGPIDFPNYSDRQKSFACDVAPIGGCLPVPGRIQEPDGRAKFYGFAVDEDKPLHLKAIWDSPAYANSETNLASLVRGNPIFPVV
ncbi:hypothetical protein NPIL_515741 [Nephila pilipes]|uniref:Uncharacterized protein n=1 Tax=Nephila pilipes TaxID=299642 RepID=A0A8X6TE26_NEPPI|nr:hypothetical protein NPIL_515741 [Nephila pilipes]